MRHADWPILTMGFTLQAKLLRDRMRSLNRTALLSFSTLAAPKQPVPASSSPAGASSADVNGHDLQSFLQSISPASPLQQPTPAAAASPAVANGHALQDFMQPTGPAGPHQQPTAAAAAFSVATGGDDVQLAHQSTGLFRSPFPENGHLNSSIHTPADASEPANGHASPPAASTLPSAGPLPHSTQLANSHSPANGDPTIDGPSLAQTRTAKSPLDGLQNGHASTSSEHAQTRQLNSGISANGTWDPDSTADVSAGSGIVMNGHAGSGDAQPDGQQQDTLVAALDKASLGPGDMRSRLSAFSLVCGCRPW